MVSSQASPRPRYPLDRRLGGPQSRSGHSGGEAEIIRSLPLPGIIVQFVA